ncbi:rhamnulokinase [Microbacter margulisiae]|uniref:Rhamnulokinase n=1 Tax=Microbacter margulisiae TaxID=1350067 RepID=A0A7W5DR63_9PORP|nr:rhamnulokinase family protein [Microbacter margulisiae]MBB3187029.1 rhamnulokinase [Microbacter margulisiae]
MSQKSFLAVDLGATSGRVICGTLKKDKLVLEEILKFPNVLVNIHGQFYWNIFQLFSHIKEGLSLATNKGIQPVSIGVDTWGVDFAFVGDDGALMGLPFSYRNYTQKENTESFANQMPLDALYEKTGIQTMDFNTIFQLYALQLRHSSQLKASNKLLFMPDAISYLLTGKQIMEYTIASTSQLLDPIAKNLHPELLDLINIKRSKFPDEMMFSGHVVGTLTKDIASETGLNEVPVVAVGGHDTASAVVAVPAMNSNFAYLSSGTWSLMGIEVPEPIINARSQQANFTNEGGVDGTIRFLKNITGMWILEQCRKEWDKQHVYSYDELMAMGQNATPFQYCFDPDDAMFSNPTSMTLAIIAYCKSTGQEQPNTIGEYVRSIFESLALKYKHVFNSLQSFASFPIEKLHIIGGGSRNSFLNQLTANALGIEVETGPAEATAIGNIMIQAKTAGYFQNLEEIRKFVRNSTKLESFLPQDKEQWQQAYQQFVERCHL